MPGTKQRRQSAEVKRNRGTAKPKPYGRTELAAELPPMPQDMGPVASAKWSELSRNLLEAGLLARVDGVALRLLCETWAVYLELQDDIKQHGVRINGKVNTNLRQLDAIIVKLRSLCREFGMTPLGRQSIKPGDQSVGDELDDEIAKVINFG